MTELLHEIGAWLQEGPIAISVISILSIMYLIRSGYPIIKQNSESNLQLKAVMDKAFDRLTEVHRKVDNQSRVIDKVDDLLDSHESRLNRHDVILTEHDNRLDKIEHGERK